MEVFQMSCVVFLSAVLFCCLPRESNSAAVAQLKPESQNGNNTGAKSLDSEPAGSGKKYTIGMEDDDLDGFSKKYGKKGSDGYKNLDKYHKRDGDSYGFSTHGGYKMGDGDGVDGAYHQSYSYDSDDSKGKKAKPSYKEWHYEKKKGQPARRSYYTSGKKEASDEEDEEFDFGGAESKLSSQISMFPSDVEIMGEMGPQKFLSLDDVSLNGQMAKAGRAKKQTDYDGYDVGGFDGEPDGADGGDGADPEYAGEDDGEGGDYDYYK
ncbi:hypothetical protein M8J75_005306 [Diaphorina citri]|nr:hypothetical protein M8J75_005306 [Diaphorina citri]